MENIHSTKKVDGIQPEKHQNIQDAKHDTKAVLAHTHHLFRKIAKNVDEASSKKSKEKQMEDSIATLRNLAKTADPQNQYKLQDKIDEIHQRDALVLAGKKIPKELKKKLDNMPQRVADDMKMPGLSTLLGNLVGIMGSNRILMMQNLDQSTSFTSGQLQQTCQELTDACTKIAQSVQEQQAAKAEADRMKSLMTILSVVLAVVSVVVAAVTMGAAAALIAVAATIVNMVPVSKDKDGNPQTCADLLADCPGMDKTKAAGVLCALEVVCTLGAGAASGGLSAASTAAEAGIEGGIEMTDMGAQAAMRAAAEGAPEAVSMAGVGAGRAAAESAEEGVFATIKNAFSKTLSAAKSLKDQASKVIDELFEPVGKALNKQLAKVGMKADFSQLGSALKLGIATGLAYNNPFGLIATDATKARLLKEFHDKYGRDPNTAEMSKIQSAADNVGLTVGIATSLAAVGFSASAASADLEGASTSSNQFVRRFQQLRQSLLDSGLFMKAAGLVEGATVGATGGISIAEGVALQQFANLTTVVGQGERKVLGLRSAKEMLENMQSFIQSQDSASIDMQSKQIQGLVDSAKNFFKT
jgi:hypothetical protein